MSLATVMGEIESERVYQDNRWGLEFDDKNTVNDWVSYICAYAGTAAMADTPMEARTQLMKVATLAVAAMQSFDRNGNFALRHYDGDS